jgi:hypothetical protein
LPSRGVGPAVCRVINVVIGLVEAFIGLFDVFVIWGFSIGNALPTRLFVGGIHVDRHICSSYAGSAQGLFHPGVRMG